LILDLYFTEESLTLGDEVSYQLRSSQRGPVAVSVRKVDQSLKQVIEVDLTGDVVREAEQNRGSFGLISAIKSTSPASSSSTVPPIPANIPFIFGDITSNSSPPQKIFKGDLVTFSAAYIPNTSYFRAQNVTVVQTKRDRALAKQIQELIANNCPLLEGHIQTLNKEFGFITSVDDCDTQYYFKVEDVNKEDSSGDLVEVETSLYSFTPSLNFPDDRYSGRRYAAI